MEEDIMFEERDGMFDEDTIKEFARSLNGDRNSSESSKKEQKNPN